MNASDKRVCVGAVAGAHGVRGAVKIKSFTGTPEDIAESYGNAGGWMHMMCCLKAFLEYGINLREGGAR